MVSPVGVCKGGRVQEADAEVDQLLPHCLYLGVWCAALL